MPGRGQGNASPGAGATLRQGAGATPRRDWSCASLRQGNASPGLGLRPGYASRAGGLSVSGADTTTRGRLMSRAWGWVRP